MDLSQLNAIPMAVVYAGLAGTLIALLVASYQNNWSCRVFFLLALRLAIGWHFLFEGLHKVHTYYLGPTDNNRVFTSEPYFTVADGPLGPIMRKQFGDVDANLQAKLEPQNLPAPFAKLSPDQRMRRNLENEPMYLDTATDEDYAKWVPINVGADWKRFVDEFAERYHLTEAEKKRIDGVLDEEEKKQIEEYDRLVLEDQKLGREDSSLKSREFDLQESLVGIANPKGVAELEAVRQQREKIAAEREAKTKRLNELSEAGVGDFSVDALAQYGRWTAGVEGRPSTMKFVSNDVDLSAPQRLEYIAVRQKELNDLKERGKAELGVGNNIEQKRMAELKALIMQAKAVLLADADAFILQLKKGVFTNAMQLRVLQQAPSPSMIVAKDPTKLDSFLPASAEATDFRFDTLPQGIQDTWNRYHSQFRSDYPESITPGIDRSYELARERTANVFSGRDEFIGKNLKVEVLKPKKSKYTQAAEKYRALLANPTNKKELADARIALLNELDGRYASLKQTLSASLPSDIAGWPAATKPNKGVGPKLDETTMWMLVAVGAMLLAGLGTRIACLVGAGFLVMTYLTHPPFPWLPLPPNTEGNPVFINKNIIEMLGLMVILVHPTGRWLGLDAIIHKIFFWKAPEPT